MTDRLRAAVMGTPAERDLDALLELLEAAHELLAQQDAVIALMTDYMDDVLGRARAFNESKLQHPEALTGAFPMYAAARLEELVRKVAAITSNAASEPEAS